MPAPDRIYTPENGDTVEYIRADLHQSALADRDREIDRLQAELAAANEAVTIRQAALEQRTAENEHLQARLKACPTVDRLRELADHCNCRYTALKIDVIAKRMEVANGK